MKNTLLVLLTLAGAAQSKAADIPHLWKPEYSYDGVRPNWTSGDCRPSETSYAW